MAGNVSAINDSAVPPPPSLLERHPPWTPLLLEFAPLAVRAERIIPPIWYILGLVGNPLSAVVWLSRRIRRNNSSAIYLGALSISDTIFLLLHFVYYLHMAHDMDTYNSHISCEIFNFLFIIPQYLAAFLVLCFTAERYIAVCHPFLKEKLCTEKRTIIIVISLVILASLISSVQLYLWSYHADTDMCNTRHAEAAEFNQSWSWVTDAIIFIILPVITLALNGLVIREIVRLSNNDVMRQQNRGNNSASTVTLLAVSFFFVATQITATTVARIDTNYPPGDFSLSDAEIREDPTWSTFFSYVATRKVLENVCLSHFAVYFLIYIATDSYSTPGLRFRQAALGLVTCGRHAGAAARGSKDKYAMVSTNGGLMSETVNTQVSTAI